MRRTKLKKTALVLIIVAIFLQIMSCGFNRKQKTVDEIAVIISQELSGKYHCSEGTFDICEIEKMDRGVNFADLYYYAKAKASGYREPFDVSIELDGTQLKDNYEGLLYGSYVEGRLDKMLQRHTDILFMNSHITYEISESASSDAEEYLKNGNAVFDASGIVQADSAECATDSVKLFLDDLQKDGFGICADISYGTRKAVLIYAFNEEVSRESLLRNFSE